MAPKGESVFILWEASPHGVGVSLYCGRSHLVMWVCPYIVGGVMVWVCPYIVGGVTSCCWRALILWEESPHGVAVSSYCGRSHFMALVCLQ